MTYTPGQKTSQGPAVAPGGVAIAPTETGTRQRSPWVALIIMLTAVFMQFLDTTITMVGVPSIQSDLGASYGEIQLVVAVYMLAFACTLVLGGRMGDTFGRKRLFLWGMVGFTLASAACGAAPDAMTLILARIAQGISSALMFPQVLGTIQVAFSKAQRPKAIAAYGATIGLATICGPVTGGGLIDLDLAGLDWRTIFYVNLPFGIFALIAGPLFLPESRSPRGTKLDVPGAALLTTGLFLLVLPLVIGREHDWPTWSFVSMGVSPFVLVLFYAYERSRTRRDASPLIDTTLFRQRPFTLGLIVSLVFFSGIGSFMMILLMTMQGGLGYSPVKAGAFTLAAALALAVGSARSAAVAKHLGSRVLVLGSVLAILGQITVMVTLHWTDTDLTGWHLIAGLFIFGLGGGFVLAPVTSVVLAGIKAKDAGSASGSLATAQQVGAAMGVAIVGVIFFGLLGSNAGSSIDSVTPELRRDLVAVGLPTPAQQQVINGFSTCFDDRANAKDPASEPASCAAVKEQIAKTEASPEVKAKVAAAVQEQAAPDALKADFVKSLRTSLWFQVGVFTLSLLLVLALPRIRLDGGAMVGGA